MAPLVAAKSIRITVLLIVLLTAIRFVSVFFPAFALQVDEAQYAGWGHHLAYGYYSKPPFIAWVLHLGQSGCDAFGIKQVEGCARMLQSLALMVASMFVMASAWQLFLDRFITAISGLLFILLPSVAFYSLLATTDPWLLMWWSIALYAFTVIMSKPLVWWPWLLLGVSLGLGVLAKYAMLAFLIGLIVGFLRISALQKPPVFSRLSVALVIASVLIYPHYQWNAALGFPTIGHHIDIAQVHDLSDHKWQVDKAFQSILAFIGGQFVVFGPLALMSLLALVASRAKQPLPYTSQVRFGVLLWGFVAPMIAIMVVEAIISRAFANWALVSYVAASILVPAYWVHNWQGDAVFGLSGRQAFIGSLLIGLLCTISFIGVPHWVQSKPYLADINHNPFRRIYGWKQVALWAKDYASNHAVHIVAQDRYLLATIAKYSYPTISTPYAWNPSRIVKNHYHQFYDIAAFKDQQTSFLLLLVGQPSMQEISQLQRSFLRVQPVEDAALSQLAVGKYKKGVWAFTVSGFKGY